VRAAEEGIPREKEKMELAMRIREKLEKYPAALAVHQLSLNSQRPADSTVRAMRNWVFSNTSGKKGGSKNPQLWGASENGHEDTHDLVVLRVPVDQHRLSSLIQTNFGLFF
jgi:hypothetical protein